MEKLTVFFDGACHLCHREIMHYQKMDKNHKLILVDISLADFEAKSFGLDEADVQINMHAKDESGAIFIGVDTFIEIWKRVAPYHLLIPFVDSRLLRPLFNRAYKFFAYHIRPKLPKRKCDDSLCKPMV